MMIRRAESKDFERIVQIAEKHNIPFPTFDDLLSLYVVVDDVVVAFGMLKKFVEVVLLPDPDLDKKALVTSLKLLQDTSVAEAKHNGIRQIHAVVIDNPSFKSILQKHYDYKECKGDFLYLNTVE